MGRQQGAGLEADTMNVNKLTDQLLVEMDGF